MNGQVDEQKKNIKDKYTCSPNLVSKYKYQLGPLTFKSKKNAKDFVSEWLRTSYDNYVVDDDDKKWIYALLDQHIKRNEKLENHNGQIYVKKNEVCSKHYNFYLGKQYPHKDTLFSYLKCFENNLSTNHILHCKQAFRNEIRPQTFQCRQTYFQFENEITCPFTNMTLRNDDYTHIDHYGKTFADLLQEFLNLHRIKYSDIELSYDNGQDHYIANQEIKNKWFNFHKENAHLLPVLKDWNLAQKDTKSNKIQKPTINKIKFRFLNQD